MSKKQVTRKGSSAPKQARPTSKSNAAAPKASPKAALKTPAKATSKAPAKKKPAPQAKTAARKTASAKSKPVKAGSGVRATAKKSAPAQPREQARKAKLKKASAKPGKQERKVVEKAKNIVKSTVSKAKELAQKVLKKASEPKPAAKKLDKPTESVQKITEATKTNAPVKPVMRTVEKAVEPKTSTPVIQSVTKSETNNKAGEMKPEEKLRYSEEELKEFEQIIVEKLEKARKELNYIKEALSRKNDPGTDTTAGTLKLLEDGADTLEKENYTQMAARQQKFIQQLENAHIRIKNGTYGICVETGKLIPKERLRAVPHTQHSIEAKLNRKD